MAIELMLNAAALNVVVFNRFVAPGTVDGQIMALFVIAVAAAEAVVGMAIFVALFRHRSTIDVNRMDVHEGVRETMKDPTGFALNHAWLIPAMPFLSFVVVGLVIRPLSKRAAGIVATSAVFASAAPGLYAGMGVFRRPCVGADIPPWSRGAFEWLRYQTGLSVNVGVLVDPISVLLMVVVTTVSALVHLYSHRLHARRHGLRAILHLSSTSSPSACSGWSWRRISCRCTSSGNWSA